MASLRWGGTYSRTILLPGIGRDILLLLPFSGINPDRCYKLPLRLTTMERCSFTEHERALRHDHLRTQSEQLLEPSRIGDFPKGQVNKVKDYDHQKNGFITDLQADRDLRSIT